jgi:hypothetical protein
MQPIEEKLASFYLGQEYDLKQGKALDQAVMYDARDLTTHGVIVGMTGSGKTGLGIILLEEAALDGIPSLVIDPKGDMTNLLLTFPDLSPEEFTPWINADDARRKNMDIPAFAKVTAEQWRKGLAGSGEGPERIVRLKDAAEFTIYTPGSSSGQPLSILDSFRVPALSWDDDSETLRDKISSVVSALLALVGIDADPVRSREHILLSNLLENAWRAGQDLDLAQLILRIQKPPFTQLGVFPVDTFYPEKERMELAMLLNGLIASPSFSDWITGDPLDVDALLHAPSGKPKVSILYIAHLSEVERQFFVTLLLEQVVSWMRAQSGTTSLRALLYMDETFGYLPPISNPPTKKPMLTLLKQARAFGLGLVLATQNPVDLDYKALTNAGTWFIGRMQADRDKQRLLDGLEGVQAGAGGPSRGELDRMISGIQQRVFILHNVRADRPTLMTTRWAMSYLRGPLTLGQVRQLLAAQAPVEEPAAAPAPKSVSAAQPGGRASGAKPAAAPVAPAPAAPYGSVPPQLPSEVQQVYLRAEVPFQTAFSNWVRGQSASVRGQAAPQATLVYQAGLVGMAKIYYTHATSRLTYNEEPAYLVQSPGEGVDWSQARVKLEAGDLKRAPEEEALYGEIPRELGAAKSMAALRKQFEEFLAFNSSLTLYYSPGLKLYSRPDEPETAFQRRRRQEAEEERDRELKALTAKIKARLKSLEDKQEREERELDRDKAAYSAHKQDELLSGAEALASLFAGRRVTRRVSSVSSKHRMSRKAKAEVAESEQAIQDLEAQIDELEAEAQQANEELTAKWQKLMDEIEPIEVRPRRTDVQVSLFALAWLPHWEVTLAGQTLSLPAFEVEAQ